MLPDFAWIEDHETLSISEKNEEKKKKKKHRIKHRNVPVILYFCV